MNFYLWENIYNINRQDTSRKSISDTVINRTHECHCIGASMNQTPDLPTWHQTPWPLCYLGGHNHKHCHNLFGVFNNTLSGILTWVYGIRQIPTNINTLTLIIGTKHFFQIQKLLLYYCLIESKSKVSSCILLFIGKVKYYLLILLT